MSVFLRSFVAIFVGLVLGLGITYFAGENPWHVFKILVSSGFGSAYDFGMTLSYSIPVIFTGLSVSVAYKAGMFNIGAEGQLVMGSLAAAVVTGLFPHLSFPWGVLIGGCAAVLAGGFWGGIVGVLKATRGAHEVILTIMMNFIAAGLASYVTVYIFQDTSTQNPQTLAIGPGSRLIPFSIFDGAPVTPVLFFVLCVAFAVWVFLYHTPWGYEWRAVGTNPQAASTAGISVKKTQIYSMTLAGVLAGLVGVNEVLGRAGCFKLGFSPGYGFTGIAVAFLARSHPIVVIVTGLLFGALQKGASDLEIYTQNVTSDLSLILQALIILLVAADGLWERVLHKPASWLRRIFL